jgi:hypothetical protein
MQLKDILHVIEGSKGLHFVSLCVFCLILLALIRVGWFDLQNKDVQSITT